MAGDKASSRLYGHCSMSHGAKLHSMATYTPALASVSLTPGDTQHPHDPDDSGVNRESSIDFNLFQCDAHDRQQHNGQI